MGSLIPHHHEAFTGFNTRMENLLLFEPLYQLDNSKMAEFKDYKLKELGFATLSYMLEQMLVGTERITPESLTIFLQKTITDVYNKQLSYVEAESLRKYLVDRKLRNSGNKFTSEYTDFETGEKKEFSLDLIVYDDYSLKKIQDNKIHLKLSDKAVELLFKTKEIFQEAQITITVLFFKQQLEKGNFSSALRIAMELAFQIEQSILTFDQQIQRMKANALSEFNAERMRENLDRSRDQTEQEKEQIEALYYQVRDIRDNYQLMKLSRKQQEKLNQVESIDQYLRQCMVRHEVLLGKKQDLLQSVKNSFELLIENIFNKTYNFQREIIDSWIDKEITQDTLSRLLMPMLPLNHKKIHNPMEAFSPQRYRRKNILIEEKATNISKETEEIFFEQEEKIRKEKENLHYKILAAIIKPIKKKEFYHISEALIELEESDPALFDLITETNVEEFIAVCIELHRINYRKFENANLREVKGAPLIVRHLIKLTKENDVLEDIEGFEIVPGNKIAELSDNFSMDNFIIIRKEAFDNGRHNKISEGA